MAEWLIAIAVLAGVLSPILFICFMFWLVHRWDL